MKINQKKNVTTTFILMYVLILANTLLLYAVLNLVFVMLLDDSDVLRTVLLSMNLVFLLSFIIQMAVLSYTYIKALKPLRTSEKKVYMVYDEIIKAKGIPASTDIVSLDEVIETVIIQQRDSWHRELTANLLRQKAELAQLQSQINPHFLYNTLDSIRGLALLKQVPEIAKMTEALSLLFRNNTRKIGMLVPLSDEIKSVDNYIVIQQFRFRDKFIFEKHISDDDQDILQCMIPSFIIQPIIENAIYHGLETNLEKGRISLIAYQTRTRLVIQVHDNGCGIPHEKLEELNQEINHSRTDDHSEIMNDVQTGIGLANINQRIKLQFGNEYGLTIASTENVGTQVEITLPLR